MYLDYYIVEANSESNAACRDGKRTKIKENSDNAMKIYDLIKEENPHLVIDLSSKNHIFKL